MGAFAPPGAAGGKVVIGRGPLAKPQEAGLPAGAIPPGGENAEFAVQGELKPAPGLAEVKPPEVIITRPAASIPSPAGVPTFKPMPTLVPAPNAKGISALPKPNRRPSRVALVGLVVLCVAGYYWFFVRTSSPAPTPVAVANPRSVASKPLPPAANEAEPRAPEAATAAATDHPAPAGALAVLPAATATAPVSLSSPASVTPPPASSPSVPSAQFRAFVDHLKISSFRTGPPAGLFVGSMACHPGDIIDEELGVVFVGFDPATSEIIFRDNTGAEIRRRF